MFPARFFSRNCSKAGAALSTRKRGCKRACAYAPVRNAHALKGIARLTNTPLEFLFPLWVEQYAREKGVNAQPFTEMLSRIVTPAEFKHIQAIRDAGMTCEHMTDNHKQIMSLMLVGPEGRAKLFT